MWIGHGVSSEDATELASEPFAEWGEAHRPVACRGDEQAPADVDAEAGELSAQRALGRADGRGRGAHVVVLRGDEEPARPFDGVPADEGALEEA